MEVLLSEQQFRAWAIEMSFLPGLGLSREESREIGLSWSEKKREQKSWFARHKPISYPCVAYVVCVSHAYEESEPRYLYPGDLRGLLVQMEGF